MTKRWLDLTAQQVAARNLETRAKSRTVHRFTDAGAVQTSRPSTGAPETQPSPVPGVPSPIPKAKATPRKRPQSRYKPPAQRESAVLDACKGILEAHPGVALWWRQNTGGMAPSEGRFVKFGFTGAPDLMAVMVGGRYLAVECKATGRKATAAQQSFLDNVRDAGGLAVCVDTPGALLNYLNGRE